jgi:hypothetical protein
MIYWEKKLMQNLKLKFIKQFKYSDLNAFSGYKFNSASYKQNNQIDPLKKIILIYYFTVKLAGPSSLI